MTLIKNEQTGEWEIIVTWSEADIRHHVEGSLGIDLTPDQSYEILKLIARSHDASVGINWDVVNSAIEEIL